jgi:hypothetical protein
MAVQFGDGVTLDLAFADALAATAGQASPRHWNGQGSALDSVPPAGAPHFRVARFEATIDGEPRYLRVAMSEARGWYLEQISSGPLSQANEIETRAGAEWRDLLTNFAHPPRASAG